MVFPYPGFSSTFHSGVGENCFEIVVYPYLKAEFGDPRKARAQAGFCKTVAFEDLNSSLDDTTLD